MQSTGSDLDGWLARLESYSPVEIVLGLERVDEVLGRLDLQLPETVFIVGGTNGKGSSVAMLDSILRAGGRRTGAYLSPHIHRYNERIRVDGVDAGDATIVEAFERIESVRRDVPLTYFEYGTLAALEIFARADLDAVVLEVGMGGRLDAVNVVTPTASLITNVALDHCAWLGNDVETIGREKAGIMRGGRPTVFAGHSPPASVASHAHAIGATLLVAGRDYDWQATDYAWDWQGTRIRLRKLRRPSLAGAVQLRNAAGVLALLEAAGEDDLLDPELLNRALTEIRIDGRMQVLERDHTWMFDVAHNPAAAEVLADTLTATPPANPVTAIIGMLDDKDVEGVTAALAPAVGRWIAVTADSPRALEAGELGRRIANVTDRPCLAAATVAEAIDYARATSEAATQILVTGSFHTVGPVLAALRREPERTVAD